MSLNIIFCNGLDCPVRDLCSRFTDIPKKGRNHKLIAVFTETPGRIAEISGKKRWICDKKL